MTRTARYEIRSAQDGSPICTCSAAELARLTPDLWSCTIWDRQSGRYLSAPTATITHQADEYVIDAPPGWRFLGLECHQLVVSYGDAGLTRNQGRRDAEAESRAHELERCPADCPCRE